MAQQEKLYDIQYLPLFWEDLSSAVTYISQTLNNPQAALKLLDEAEEAILSHAIEPTMASIYKTTRDRSLPYCWFPVGNFMVFYVVLEDCIEVRRFLYGSSNIEGMIPLTN